MKPAPFEYHSPRSLEEALGLMANLGDQARPLAGGQSLVPMLSMRLARPAAIVDLNGIPELAYHRIDSDALVVGTSGPAGRRGPCAPTDPGPGQQPCDVQRALTRHLPGRD